jgi:hypothetical protein
MPGFDGTGPQGKGPMTGRGSGYCVLRESAEIPSRIEGLAGIAGVPVNDVSHERIEQKKEVIQMPLGDGTGPTGRGAMTGRAAGFCAGYGVPGYRNPGVFGARRTVPMYETGAGYVAPRVGWFGRWMRGGMGLGRRLRPRGGRGWRGGWGRLGYW